MEPLRRAVACHCLPAPIRRSIRSAVEMGASGIQFDVRQELRPADLSDSGRRQLRHDLEIEGLTISSLSFPTRRSLYDPEQLEARVSGLKQALDFAYQLRVPTVVARIGAIPQDKESVAWKSLIEVLNDVARHANRVGATLAITPTRDSAAELNGLIAQVKDGLVGINFDPAVFAMCGHDAVAAYRELHTHVLHITGRDGVRDIDGTGQEVALGRGDVDWPELLALLNESGYRGWITVDRSHGDDLTRAAERALTYLKNVIAS
ncbi:MAG: sugar phosphate isomerase/epimerase family protein [Planctomycetaceae bacterium]